MRARLLWAFVVPLVLVLALVGLVSTTVLRNHLVDQVDSRLMATQDRAANAALRFGHPTAADAPDADAANSGKRPATPDFYDTPGQGDGTLSAVIDDGICTQGATLTADGQSRTLTRPQAIIVAYASASTDARTVHLGGDLGDYRLMASPISGGTVIVTGLPLSSTSDAVRNLVTVEFLAGLLGLAAALGVAALMIRSAVRPLDRVAATAALVSELPLASGEVRLAERVPPDYTDPRTEVGQVGTALNRMLDHVEGSLAARQQSETQVRQFVADASHELRTPLASIRGYAELVRRQHAEVPPDVGYAVRRVESEALRMSELVEELLLLARLDAGRELSTEEVDLTALVVDTVSDAHAAGPTHRWQVDLPDSPVVVPGDPARLHQVLANLLANVRSHTPDGTTATTRLRAEAGWAVLQVADDGLGIPAALRPHVFERFARGDASRSRTAGSTGLGLAIVHAVVAAHGGTVEVASEPGRTAFTVRLPHAEEGPGA
ncbi:sensor histidine kinase [Modestobacter altitudinis]|uniref:sensor histidine kinase n=1 Tax=Modestobacter altitudinis TaxID=2213158 RepID=UPI001FE775FB|nr:HAMP domain-containing sensor histidine kinase [Modestobacter altitudinis]